MDKTKSFKISKQVVWKAYQRVKANKGAAGIDKEPIIDFEQNLKDNLYKLWNRMSSGSYLPPPVKAVEIPKKNGGLKRVLGIPTVADRIAQMTVKMYFEPMVEPYFYPDSYGYRPGKSALEAIRVTRRRCWRYHWILEYDIKGLFDNIDHELLMRAVRKHTNCKWIILYIERWLKAPFKDKDGLIERKAGTPQGGVISPVLANLFLHYVFDKWIKTNFPQNPWARYADDGIVHTKTKVEAENLLEKLEQRFKVCKLELHSDKTRVVYCKDDDRSGNYPEIKFDFLGYTFRPRRSKNRYGKHFINFTPAVSNKSCKVMRQVIRSWRIHLKPDKELIDISRMLNPVIRGWINYYGCFYKSGLYPVLRKLNRAIIHWARRKYKRLARHRRRAEYWLGRIARREPQLFAHWQMGILPTAG